MIRTALTAAAVVLALCTAGTAAAATAAVAPQRVGAASGAPAHPVAPARSVPLTGPGKPARTPRPKEADRRSDRRPDLLRVTYDNGHGVVTSRSLRCHPSGGSLRGTSGACRRLDALGGPVGSTPKREMCSMVFGGPQTARVTGTWHGRRVDQSYNRSNGCQTSRWQRMEPVLPAIGGGGSRPLPHP